MRRSFHPFLVNDPFGDPALYIDFLFERRALMFDLGDIRALPPRKMLRVSDIFISHAHMDHFMGFDWLLRICLGRERQIRLYGPPGFVDQVQAKLSAYTWNLVHRYENDLSFTVTELLPDGSARRASFHIQDAFQRKEEASFSIRNGVLLEEAGFRVRCTFLDHRTPCLAFALEEKQHVNIWKNKLVEMGLPVGSWLRELKVAVLEGRPPETRIAVPVGLTIPLGDLMHCLQLTRGQKLAYVTDAVFNEQNIERIIALSKDADQLYIEAMFSHDQVARAQEKHHLTAAQAGWLAHQAKAKTVVPFHYSPLNHGNEAQLREELHAHFQSGIAAD